MLTAFRTMKHVKPGERVETIRRIAATLEGQEWDDIDLVLGQFKFPTYDEWRGTTSGYIVEMIKDGTDDALADLDAYLNQGDAPTTEPQPSDEIVLADPASPWKTGGFRLFLTHLAAQREEVGKLRTALADHSIETFVAHQTIDAGEEWEDVIKSGLHTCDALAAWLTPGIKNSNWCDQEIGFAVCRGVLVVPIRFGVDPYGFIGRYQALTVRTGDKYHVIARSIFDLLVRHPLSQEAMARALVWRYENTGSFDQARVNLGFLRMIPDEAWTSALKDQARGAGERNSQLYDAYSGNRLVPTIVNELIPD